MQSAPIPTTQTPTHIHRSLIKHTLTHTTYPTGSYQTQAGSYFKFLNILLFLLCFFFVYSFNFFLVHMPLQCANAAFSTWYERYHIVWLFWMWNAFDFCFFPLFVFLQRAAASLLCYDSILFCF